MPQLFVLTSPAKGQGIVQFALGWERDIFIATCTPQPSQRVVECHHLLHSQTLAREQENTATICTHPPNPGSGGVLQCS